MLLKQKKKKLTSNGEKRKVSTSTTRKNIRLSAYASTIKANKWSWNLVSIMIPVLYSQQSCSCLFAGLWYRHWGPLMLLGDNQKAWSRKDSCHQQCSCHSLNSNRSWPEITYPNAPASLNMITWEDNIKQTVMAILATFMSTEGETTSRT